VIVSTAKVSYTGYIGLAALRDAVRPLTPEHDVFTHGAEHLFIVTHQVAELWLKQVLLDLDLTEWALAERELTRADEHLVRASQVFNQVISATSMLTRLPPSDFAGSAACGARPAGHSHRSSMSSSRASVCTAGRALYTSASSRCWWRARCPWPTSTAGGSRPAQ
jgi:hypothetical protein